MPLLKNLKTKQLTSNQLWALGWLLLSAVSVALVYYWRVYFSLQVSALPFTAGVWAGFSLLYGVIYIICRFFGDNFNLKAAFCIFIAGILFCFASVPLQVPDETDHFKRAYQIGIGNLDFDGTRTFDSDFNALYEAFPKGYNHSVKYQNMPMAPHAFETYTQLAKNGTAAVQTEPVNFLVLPYLPQALGVAVAHLFGFGALGALYGARLVNLAAYALIAYFTLKKCNRYKPLFLGFLLLPLNLYLGASASYDSTMLAFSLYLIAVLAQDEVTAPDVIAFICICAFISGTKLNNIILLLPLLLVAKANWKSRLKKWHAGVICIAGTTVFTQLMSLYVTFMRHGYDAGATDRWLAEVVPADQIRFIFANLPRYICVMLGTLYENSTFLFDMGNFGWTDLNLPFVANFSVVVLLICTVCSVCKNNSVTPLAQGGIFITAGGFICAVLTGLYVTWTPVGMIRIIGLQARYFIPAFLLLFMLLTIWLGSVVTPRAVGPKAFVKADNAMLALCVIFAVISGVLLFQSAFLGQWIVKGDSSSWVLLSA
ncbi:MAG: DUF2142 domain-containing protein [Oscillospiraceae bacterium]|nr:DUF2142 domain-containing protein [Oscillospiraceae bacterium]